MSPQDEICAVCGKPIKPGEGAAIDRGKVMHLACYEKRAPAS
jgi:hypothetical protein